MQKKVILGMSGGVDSSVAGALLKDQGYQVIGLFMKNWDEKTQPGLCSAAEDYDDVRAVANQLEIPYYTVNFEKQYKERVFSYFLEEYRQGRTPNPDVMCNQEIKFSAFLEFALTLEADYIAMGHYAQVRQTPRGNFELLRGADEKKDQSYFLSRVGQAALAKTLFPIGHLTKPEVRQIAVQKKLATASKKDSTGVCFIGERDFDGFLDQFLTPVPGDIIDLDTKRTVGRHTGLIHYTVGQRKGIGLGGVGSGEPWFVASKDLSKNQLLVAQGERHRSLYSIALRATDAFWISGEPPAFPLVCTAKFRYRQADIPVTVTPDPGAPEKKNATRLRIGYAEPVKAVTPGQIAVLYQGDVCLGSCIIDHTEAWG